MTSAAHKPSVTAAVFVSALAGAAAATLAITVSAVLYGALSNFADFESHPSGLFAAFFIFTPLLFLAAFPVALTLSVIIFMPLHFHFSGSGDIRRSSYLRVGIVVAALICISVFVRMPPWDVLTGGSIMHVLAPAYYLAVCFGVPTQAYVFWMFAARRTDATAKPQRFDLA